MDREAGRYRPLIPKRMKTPDFERNRALYLHSDLVSRKTSDYLSVGDGFISSAAESVLRSIPRSVSTGNTAVSYEHTAFPNSSRTADNHSFSPKTFRDADRR